MLRRFLPGIAFFLILSPTFAGTIGATSANPASAPAGVPTQITFTSLITDTTVIPSTVNLQQIDAAGRATVLGTLHDDGLSGDAVAGDQTYTLRTTVFQQIPGAVTFRVSAGFQGSLLRANSAPITVSITGTGTAIAIVSPAQSAYLNISPVLVTGTVSDSQATVAVNSVPAQVTGNSFTASVPLQEGSNTLTAVAQNSGGGTSTDSRLVTLDTTPPHVTISSPSVSAVTTASSVNVTGIINDIVVGTVNPQQATVTVNGIPAVVSNRTYIASNVPLGMGANTIQALGTDRAGNFATTSVSITRQSPVTPTLTIVSGNNLSGPIKSQLAAPLVVKLTDSSGNGVPNTPVVFQVTGGDGTLTTAGPPGLPGIAINTNGQGQAQVFYILGSHAGSGNNMVQASSVGIAATPVFTESATTTPPSMIVVDSGNNQSGVVGQALPLPFIAILTDAGHNRLGNVPVTFTMKQGGGTINGQTTYNTTSDSDGRVQGILTLGPQAGINNNLVEANFLGNAGLPASFTATAYVPGPPQNTAISGVVLDNSNIPIPNVMMRLYQVNNGTSGNTPVQIGTPVPTNAQGYFLIQPAPVGVFKLMADGSTATRPGPFPTLEYDMVTVAGQNNTVGLPIYLPQLSSAGQLCVSPTTGGTLTVPQAPGFALTIAPGSATFPGGSRTGCVSVTPVNMDKVPMVPGFGQQPRFIVTIQPVGTIFNPPAAITIPNVDGLAPRAVTEMYSYDHDLASFVAIGTGTVSADGSVIASDPGVGVLKAGWHCGGDPNSAGGGEVVHVTITTAPPVTIMKNATATITASGGPEGTYSWTSSDPAIAAIQSGGATASVTVKGMAPGMATLTVRFTCNSVDQNGVHPFAEATIAVTVAGVVIDAIDPMFAPGVEQLQITYSIVPPGATVANAKLEIFKNGDAVNPIYRNTTIAKTGTSVMVNWDGKATLGANAGKFVGPDTSPYTAKITVSQQADFSNGSFDQKNTLVVVESITLTPAGDRELTKPSRAATEIDTDIEALIKLKKKDGTGAAAPVAVKVTWTFTDPDDTATDMGIDSNGAAGDDNAPVGNGGKRGMGSILWKASMGYTTSVAADGQSADVTTLDSGADMGKAKTKFSSSAISADNYILKAQVKDTAGTVLKDAVTGTWSVWKSLTFANAYRMNGGADVGAIMATANVDPAFSGDGYTHYAFGAVTAIPAGANSPDFLVPLLVPNAAETPSAAELADFASGDAAKVAAARVAITAKAQAWYDRNQASGGAALTALAGAIGVATPGAVGCKYFSPKEDGNAATGATAYYPAGIMIMAGDSGAVSPDGEWGQTQGVEFGQIAWIPLNTGNAARQQIVGRHEAGHASDHVSFGAGDHAADGLMTPFGASNMFSPDSILRLRGWSR